MDTLPLELLELILTFCNGQEWMHLSQTCSRWNLAVFASERRLVHLHGSQLLAFRFDRRALKPMFETVRALKTRRALSLVGSECARPGLLAETFENKLFAADAVFPGRAREWWSRCVNYAKSFVWVAPFAGDEDRHAVWDAAFERDLAQDVGVILEFSYLASLCQYSWQVLRASPPVASLRRWVDRIGKELTFGKSSGSGQYNGRYDSRNTTTALLRVCTTYGWTSDRVAGDSIVSLATIDVLGCGNGSPRARLNWISFVSHVNRSCTDRSICAKLQSACAQATKELRKKKATPWWNDGRRIVGLDYEVPEVSALLEFTKFVVERAVDRTLRD